MGKKMTQSVDFGEVEEHEVVTPKEVMNSLVEDTQDQYLGQSAMGVRVLWLERRLCKDT